MHEAQNAEELPSRLLFWYMTAGDDGLNKDSVMLGSMVGDELQSISLQVAADSMVRWNKEQA